MIRGTLLSTRLKTVILSLGVVIACTSLSPRVSHAIPIAGDYVFTSGLTGSFTSNGTRLTVWAITDSSNFLWTNVGSTASIFPVMINTSDFFNQVDPTSGRGIAINWRTSLETFTAVTLVSTAFAALLSTPASGRCGVAVKWWGHFWQG